MVQEKMKDEIAGDGYSDPTNTVMLSFGVKAKSLNGGSFNQPIHGRNHPPQKPPRRRCCAHR